jgi:uncharacterized protein (TIRG00374 family)
VNGRHIALLCLQGAVTVAALTMLWRQVDARALVAVLAAVPLRFYLLSLATILGGQIIYAWRWHVVLRAAGVQASFASVVRQYFVGIFVNNFLPGTVGGDVAKVYYLGRDHGYRTVTASIVIDRLMGVSVLALLAAAVQWVAPQVSIEGAGTRIAVTAVAIGTVGVLLLVMTGTGGISRWLVPFGARAAALGDWLQRTRREMAAPLHRRSVLLAAVSSVVLYFVAITGIYIWFFHVQMAVRLPFLPVFWAASAATVLSNVPVSLNGLGVREQLHAWLLAPLGVRPEIAVSLSLLLFSHLLVASLVGWVMWLRAPATARFTPVKAPT